MRSMKERQASGTPLSRRFRLVLLHLAEEARRNLDLLAARPARAVHALRTRMKNLRAILLLVKPRIPKPSRKAVSTLAGSLKDAFSVTRDAHMLTALRAKIAGRRESEARRTLTPHSAARNQKAKADASRLIRMVSKIALDGLAWPEVFEGYLRTYRAGRKAMKACEHKPTAEEFHEWRRPVKDLFFQSQVFQPLDGMTARRRRADRLGTMNDLRLLHAEAKKNRDSALLKQIVKKQRALVPAIFKAAAKLYDERPRDIATALERCVKFQPAIAAQAVRQA